MAVQRTTMVFEVTEVETLVKYVIIHNHDMEFAFRLAVEWMGINVRMFAIREEHMENICTVVRVFIGQILGLKSF